MEQTATKEPLAKIRKDAGFTIDSLAGYLGVDRTTVIRWERGEPRIPVSRLEAVSSALGCKKVELRPDIFGEAA